jgi:DNA-binding response OmpR family regulator
VFFVSGDEKPDWWHRSEGQTLYPRYELVDEFRRHSEGQSFHIIPFSQFLEIYGASQSIVQEVRREEVKVSQELEVTRAKPVESGEVLRFADLILDTSTREVRRGARKIDLTAKEFDLLELFMRHPQQVLTRDVIFDRIWDPDFGGESNIIEVYVRYLRVKTEEGGGTRLLQTVRGYGYVLREE